jgi:hypothetical protein
MIFISANKEAAILPTHQRLTSHRKTLKLKAQTLSVNLESTENFLFYSHLSILQLMQSQRVVSDVARTLKLKALTPCVSHRLESHRKPLKLKALTLSVKLELMGKFLFHSHQSILQLMQSQRAVSKSVVTLAGIFGSMMLNPKQEKGVQG